MMALRPIGTEFDVYYPASEKTTTASPVDTVLTYRVVAHVSVARFPGDKVGQIVEEVKCIARKEETFNY